MGARAVKARLGFIRGGSKRSEGIIFLIENYSRLITDVTQKSTVPHPPTPSPK